MDAADQFGFLNWERTIAFEGGRITPVSKFKEAAAWVDSHTNEDGFLYSGESQKLVLHPKTNRVLKRIPRTKRPALLHRIPASHELYLSDAGLTEDCRREVGAFVIHLLGYLFGTRLQFWDWWFDGRVPIRSTHNISFTEATAEDFLSHCCQTWRGWTKTERRLLTNALYMHCRAPMYEWDWERFAIEYMVLDTCLKLANLGRGIKDKTSESAKKRCCRQRIELRRVGKAKRPAEPIEIVCCRFEIPVPSDNSLVQEVENKEIVEKIVRLRNQLFHEALWDDSQPCTGVASDTFLQTYNLRRLNQRLIPALLGYNNRYVQTCWWSMGHRIFGPSS